MASLDVSGKLRPTPDHPGRLHVAHHVQNCRRCWSWWAVAAISARDYW